MPQSDWRKLTLRRRLRDIGQGMRRVREWRRESRNTQADDRGVHSEVAMAFARRLRAVLPWYVRIAVVPVRRGVAVEGFSLRGLRWIGWRSRSEASDPNDPVSVACELESILASLQHLLIEVTGRAWPRDDPLSLPNSPDERDAFWAQVSRPRASAEGDRIRLWFGDEQAPVLEVEPIPVSRG